MKLSKVKALYGLKWNPFTSDLPIEGIAFPEMESDFLANKKIW